MKVNIIEFESFNHYNPKLGWILIDRCGKHFAKILNFLRDGFVPLPDNQHELNELLIEAKYYLIQDLIDQCESALKKYKTHKVMEPVCSILVSYLFNINTCLKYSFLDD